MGLFFLIVYVSLTFVRPMDLYPELASLRLMGSVGLLCALATLGGLIGGRGPSHASPQMWLTLAFIFWAPLTIILGSRWFGGGLIALETLLPTAVLFLFALLNVDTLSRFRALSACLIVLGGWLSLQGVLAVHTGYRAKEFVFLASDMEVDEDRGGNSLGPGGEGRPSAGGQLDSATVRARGRVRGLGFFNDPNDLAQALVAILPLLGMFHAERRRLRNLVLIWAPAALIVYGTYLTHSRGALLALVVLFFLMVRRRLGAVVAASGSGIATVALLASGFAAGRSIEGDSSAEGRIEAWNEGFQMLKSSPLWGIGFGGFAEHHGLAAHNSFINCLAETGLIGYFIWIGLLVSVLADLRALGSTEDGESEDWVGAGAAARCLGQSLVAYLVAAYFLSRTYSPMLFLLVGLGAALADLARRHSRLPEFRVAPWVALSGAVTILSIVLLNASVKIGTLIPGAAE